MPPEDLRKFSDDRAAMDDMRAVIERATDLLVKHGVLAHERDGLKPDPTFEQMFAVASAKTDSLHEALMAAIYARSGGRAEGEELKAMSVQLIQRLGGTDLGRALDDEARRWCEDRGEDLTYEMARREVRRDRESLESSPL